MAASFLPHPTTVAPEAASRFARSSPTPEVAPVITTLFPAKASSGPTEAEEWQQLLGTIPIAGHVCACVCVRAPPLWVLSAVGGRIRRCLSHFAILPPCQRQSRCGRYFLRTAFRGARNGRPIYTNLISFFRVRAPT